MTQSFVHLRIHSEYSMVDGIVRIKPLVKKAAESGLVALALTDEMNLFAAVKFYRSAIAAGIKPIIGADLLITHPQDSQQVFRLTLLCQNRQGYLNLISLISRAYTEGQTLGKPQIQFDWLEHNVDGLLALSAGIAGEIGQCILSKPDEVEPALKRYQDLFPGRFYLELQRTGRKNEDYYINAVLPLAEKLHIPIVATNGVCFLAEEDFEAHEARVCIHDGRVLSDPKREKRYSQQQYLRNAQQMQVLFADLPQALANTIEIAKRCNLQLELDKNYLPNFPVPVGMTIEQFFSAEAKAGLEQRLCTLFEQDVEKVEQQRSVYDERLQVELDVINKMGFPGYFLIVADFIRWAKQNGVPVGPGRGSGAGSLVAYALEITDLDPLKYELLFERFLNPERVSMPDFDVDFCMDGRDRVIDYVATKYGRESVGQIITFGSMAAKAVIRDVGRVLDQPYGFVDKIAKLIPFEIGMTLDKAIEQEELLQQRYQEEEDVQALIDLAKKLEGITRNAGKHAGGVVISPSKLTDFSAIYCEQDGSSLVTQYDKDDVESVGLVKFDFLGLRNLTSIDWAVAKINRNLKQLNQPSLDISRIPMDDPQTFALLKNCQTTAVFQLESRGMKDLIKRLQPDCFEDIIALVALFRPGPLQSGMVDDFINRKHGRAEVVYPHPDLEYILKPTYGVILYQEQVMQIAQVLANYSLGAADLLRRAMGKKKPEEMAKQREIFISGAKERDVDVKTATMIFDLMEKFAGYGFNKSHSAAYALVSYQTAWLKAHYPAEFMASVLSSDLDNTDKVVTLIEDCRELKLKFVAPDVNQSFYKFTVNDDGHIVYGLGAIKGVGEAAIDAIVESREDQGPFNTLFELCRRVDGKKANRRCYEALVRSGACDGLGTHRANLMFNLNAALLAAEQYRHDQLSGQEDLFSQGTNDDSEDETQTYHEIKEWDDDERLRGEKETLGLYLTGHPISRYLDELSHITQSRIANLQPSSRSTVMIAGLIVGLRTMQTRRGDRMAIVTLDDRSGRIELLVFAELFHSARDLLVKDNIIVVEGDVSVDDYSGGYRISAKRLFTIDGAREFFASRVIIHLDHQNLGPSKMDALKGVLQQYQSGACPVALSYSGREAKAQLRLGGAWRVKPSDEMIRQLTEVFGDDSVTVQYA